jgi:transposase
MAPLVRRTWALRGHTPRVVQRTRTHKKVSAIAALCINPKAQAVSLCFRLHPDASIDGGLVIEFLRHLLRYLPGPILLIWDRLNAHRSHETMQFLLTKRPRLQTYFLPPYAPELNPVEQIWGYLKMNPLVNYPLYDVSSLAHETRRYIRSVQCNPGLLQSFLQHTPLSFCFR